MILHLVLFISFSVDSTISLTMVSVWDTWMLELGEHSLSVKISSAKSDEIFENISSLLTDEINNRHKFLTDEYFSPTRNAASKPLTLESFWCLRWLYVSTVYRTWRGFKSLNLRDTFISPSATPFDNCLLTLPAYHALNLFEINFFADWLMPISKGWNLLARLCGTITDSQLFFEHNCFISSLSWPLKVSIIIEGALVFRVAKLLLFGRQIWKDNYFE